MDPNLDGSPADTLKITLVVIIPILFFALTFAVMLLYRVMKARQRIDHLEWGPVHPSRPATHSHSRCDGCGEAHQPSSGILVHPNSASAATSSTDLGSHPRRGSNLTQPHFAEKTTRIRRISTNPAEGDTLQRVSSITSTLVPSAQASSELLSLGGRRASAGSGLSYASLSAPHPGQITMGDRRASVLSDPDFGMLNVRRVSVGGMEDVVIVRSGSQSSEARRRSLATGKVGSADDMPSPILPSSHPFASGKPSNSSYGTTQPLRLDQPPKKTTKRPMDRPDSIDLIKHHIATSDITSQTPLPPSADPITYASGSMEALKSPMEPWSADPSTPKVEIFQAWRGFPLKGTVSSASFVGSAQALSPKTPTVARSDEVDSAGDVLSSRLENIPATPEAASRSKPQALTTAVSARSKQLANIVAHSPAAPAVIPQPAETTPESHSRKTSRITYLAEVVRENEERRRKEREDASSTVAMASLEERRSTAPRPS